MRTAISINRLPRAAAYRGKPAAAAQRSAAAAPGENDLVFVHGDARLPRPRPAEPGRIAGRGQAAAFVFAGIFLGLAGMVACDVSRQRNLTVFGNLSLDLIHLP